MIKFEDLKEDCPATRLEGTYRKCKLKSKTEVHSLHNKNLNHTTYKSCEFSGESHCPVILAIKKHGGRMLNYEVEEVQTTVKVYIQTCERCGEKLRHPYPYPNFRLCTKCKEIEHQEEEAKVAEILIGAQVVDLQIDEADYEVLNSITLRTPDGKRWLLDPQACHEMSFEEE